MARRGLVSALFTFFLLSGVSVAATSGAREGSPADQLPNLTPVSASDVVIATADDDTQVPALRFDATIWNRGDYAFELLGRPTDASMDELDAEQCVAWAAPYACSARRSVGKLIHHD